jgi:hypothetical protein
MIEERENGIITDVFREKRFAVIQSGLARWTAFFSRFRESPGRHGCIVSVGDEVEFVRKNDKHLKAVYFCQQLDVQLNEVELSRVTAITPEGYVFADRVNPACRCPISIGRLSDHPVLEVGTLVRHRLTMWNGKAVATDVRVEPEEALEVQKGAANG